MLDIIDITMPVREGMTTWPGLRETLLPPAARIAEGDAANVTDLLCCTHTGTHVDSPFHHFTDGYGIEKLNMSTLIGPARVLDLTHVEEAIEPADLKAFDAFEPTEILLIRTKNSMEKQIWEGNFLEDYIYISPAAAKDIVQRGIKTVGVDCLSVEGYRNSSQGGPTHKALLKDGAVTIVEGLDLRRVDPGLYWFICLPLKLVGSDGAPARALLARDPNNALLKAWTSSEKHYL